MLRVVSCALLLLALITDVSTAHAGPVEAFDRVFVNPTNPKNLLLHYINGGGGILLSDDGGKSFHLLCSTAVDRAIGSDTAALALRADGAPLLGVPVGMWVGDAKGCGFHEVPGLSQQWLADFAIDPLDNARTYAVTSAGGKANGLYVNSGKSDSWNSFGKQAEILIGRVQVTTRAPGKRRFYESAVHGSYDSTDPMTQQPVSNPKYVLRVSDDDAQTWTEYVLPETDGELRLAAVNPKNPDQVVITIRRGDPTNPDDSVPDDVLWLDVQAGSTPQLIGQVTKLGGASFAPDGRLFYGDISQNSPALFAVSALGSKPKKLAYPHKAGCIHYDAQTDKLYVCQDAVFGTVDPKSGAFAQLFSLKEADAFVECAGKPATADACQAQLLEAYCGITHFPYAPLCAGYGIVDAGAPTPDASRLQAEAGPGTAASAQGCSCSLGAAHRQSPPVGWRNLLSAIFVFAAVSRGRRARARRRAGSPAWLNA